MAAAGPSLASQARALVGGGGGRSASQATLGCRTAARASRSPGCQCFGVHNSACVTRGSSSTAGAAGRAARPVAAPARASASRSPRRRSPPPAAGQERDAQRSPRPSSPQPTPTHRRRASAPSAPAASRAQMSACKERFVEMTITDSPRASPAPDSPRTIDRTESALQKSQLLLDKLLCLDLSEADFVGNRMADSEAEVQAPTEPPSAWAWPAQPSSAPSGATAEVPVELLSMLAEMWNHVKEEKQRQALPLVSPPLEICIPSAEKSRGSPAISSPGSTRLLTGSVSPSSSPGGSSAASSIMSQGDKAQLILELREVLHASLVPKTTLSPVISFRNPISARPAVPRAALSPRYRTAAISPPRSAGLRARAAASPLRPTSAAFAQQPRRMVLQQVAVTNVHHVLTAC